jgi:tetratricopeptide (TPR) repeat protein
VSSAPLSKLEKELDRVESLVSAAEQARAPVATTTTTTTTAKAVTPGAAGAPSTPPVDYDAALRAARAVVASAAAASAPAAPATPNEPSLELEAHMLLGRAQVAAGDSAAGEATLRTAAKLPGKAPRRDLYLTRRSARTRILALRCLATLSAASRDFVTARLCYSRMLSWATACAGSVAQMAGVDPAIQPALEEALFDAPTLAVSSAHVDVDADAVHALRCALAAPMRLTRRAGAQRVRLLLELAHRLLTAHSGAAFARCDSAALVAVVGATAATARRVVPRDVVDEACVLLRLALAERLPTDVPTALRAADPLTDHLCLALARRGAFADAVADLELELSHSPSDSHTQMQFALALAASGLASRAVDRLHLWLDEFGGSAAPIDTVSVHLLVAKLLLNDLGLVGEANTEARVALQHAEHKHADDAAAIAAAALAVGATSAARARTEQVGSRRQRLEADARTSLRRAARLNPVSGDVAFALALAHADVRAITPALELARAAVALRADAAAWNLLALLLSSRRRFKRALAATKAGLKLGDDIQLLRTQAQLQHALGDTPGAMRSLMRAFATFRQQRATHSDRQRASGVGTATFSGSEPSVLSARTMDDARTSDMRSTGARSIASRSVLGAPTTPGVAAPNGAATVVAPAASAAADGERPNVGYGDLDLWLDVGTLFREVQQWDEADACLAEMRKLEPLAPTTLSFEASLAMGRGRAEEAEQLYEKVLSLYPTHATSLRDSGVLLLERNDARQHQHHHESAPAHAHVHAHGTANAQLLLAEQRLQQAVRQDPMDHVAWLGLGRVLLAKCEHERATECFFTQIELEHTAPVRPFSSVAYLL